MNNRDYQYDEKVVQSFFDYYYVDRGMLKWQGFFLSDHTAALKRELKMNEYFYERPIPEQMTGEAIRKKIAQAVEKNLMVIIQTNQRNQNLLFEDEITGSVIGFEGDRIYLDDGESIRIEEIRAIDIVINDS